MVVKEGGLKLIQIQDNGTGIRVSKTSEEQDVCVHLVIHTQEVAEPFPVLETRLLWMGLFEKFSSNYKYLLNTYSVLGTVQGNKEV